MVEGRQAGPDFCQAIPVNPAGNHPPTVDKLRYNPSPRIDYQGMPPGLAFTVMCPDLSRRNNITGILNGPRSQQRQPVIGTRGHGKRGWYHKNFRPLVGQGAVQLRKPEVAPTYEVPAL